LRLEIVRRIEGISPYWKIYATVIDHCRDQCQFIAPSCRISATSAKGAVPLN
jgi:hypothetical protein